MPLYIKIYNKKFYAAAAMKIDNNRPIFKLRTKSYKLRKHSNGRAQIMERK